MIEQRERLTQNLNVRAAPSEVRRLEAAAELAGVSRSTLIRQGARKLAKRVLRRAADGEDETDRRE